MSAVVTSTIALDERKTAEEISVTSENISARVARVKALALRLKEDPTVKTELAELQFEIGEAHYRGKGVSKDPERAMQHFMSAAIQGHGVAQYVLANPDLFHSVPEDGLRYVSVHIFADIDFGSHVNIAQKLSEHAQMQGKETAYGIAQFCTREKSEHTLSEIRNHRRSSLIQLEHEFYTMAADSNHTKAQCDLGKWYTRGENDFEKNLKTGLKYYRDAARSGCTESRFQLAVHAFQEKSFSEARGWCALALKGKYTGAQQLLDRIDHKLQEIKEATERRTQAVSKLRLYIKKSRSQEDAAITEETFIRLMNVLDQMKQEPIGETAPYVMNMSDMTCCPTDIRAHGLHVSPTLMYALLVHIQSLPELTEVEALKACREYVWFQSSEYRKFVVEEKAKGAVVAEAKRKAEERARTEAARQARAAVRAQAEEKAKEEEARHGSAPSISELRLLYGVNEGRHAAQYKRFTTALGRVKEALDKIKIDPKLTHYDVLLLKEYSERLKILLEHIESINGIVSQIIDEAQLFHESLEKMKAYDASSRELVLQPQIEALTKRREQIEKNLAAMDAQLKDFNDRIDAFTETEVRQIRPSKRSCSTAIGDEHEGVYKQIAERRRTLMTSLDVILRVKCAEVKRSEEESTPGQDKQPAQHPRKQGSQAKKPQKKKKSSGASVSIAEPKEPKRSPASIAQFHKARAQEEKRQAEREKRERILALMQIGAGPEGKPISRTEDFPKKHAPTKPSSTSRDSTTKPPTGSRSTQSVPRAKKGSSVDSGTLLARVEPSIDQIDLKKKFEECKAILIGMPELAAEAGWEDEVKTDVLLGFFARCLEFLGELEPSTERGIMARDMRNALWGQWEKGLHLKMEMNYGALHQVAMDWVSLMNDPRIHFPREEIMKQLKGTPLFHTLLAIGESMRLGCGKSKADFWEEVIRKTTVDDIEQCGARIQHVCERLSKYDLGNHSGAFLEVCVPEAKRTCTGLLGKDLRLLKLMVACGDAAKREAANNVLASIPAEFLRGSIRMGAFARHDGSVYDGLLYFAISELTPEAPPAVGDDVTATVGTALLMSGGPAAMPASALAPAAAVAATPIAATGAAVAGTAGGIK